MRILSLERVSKNVLGMTVEEPINREKILYLAKTDQGKLEFERFRRISKSFSSGFFIPNSTGTGNNLVFLEVNESYVLNLKTKFGWTSIWLEKFPKKVKNFKIREIQPEDERTQRYVVVGENVENKRDKTVQIWIIESRFGASRSRGGGRSLEIVEQKEIKNSKKI